MLWQEHGHKTLPVLLGATDMLVCGEDLGMIPKCVHPTMEEMGIIGGRCAVRCVSARGRHSSSQPNDSPLLAVACQFNKQGCVQGTRLARVA